MLQPSNLPNSARFLPFLPLAWPLPAPCLRDLRDLVDEKWLMVAKVTSSNMVHQFRGSKRKKSIPTEKLHLHVVMSVKEGLSFLSFFVDQLGEVELSNCHLFLSTGAWNAQLKRKIYLQEKDFHKIITLHSLKKPTHTADGFQKSSGHQLRLVRWSHHLQGFTNKSQAGFLIGFPEPSPTLWVAETPRCITEC